MEPQKRLKHSMEPQKGLKDLLWDTLGLKTVVDPDAGQPQPHEASTANLAEVPQQQPDAGADVAAPEPAATIDEHDAAFAAKIASIKNHVGAGACKQTWVQCFAESASLARIGGPSSAQKSFASTVQCYAYTASSVHPTRI
jgi:hypothetical protein